MDNSKARALFYNSLPYGLIMTDKGIILFNRHYAKLGTEDDWDTRPERKEYEDTAVYLYKDSYDTFPLFHKNIWDAYRTSIVKLKTKYELHPTEPYTYDDLLKTIHRITVGDIDHNLCTS